MFDRGWRFLGSDFEALITEAERELFSGWDFSYIEATNRYRLEPVSWDYNAIVRERMKKAESMLDMGTGGGERLAELRPFPKMAYATEGYVPNVPIARKRLESLGVRVIQVTSEEDLPFPNESFDLIINHHSGYSVRALHRVLKPGGTFLTQQVGDRNNRELNELLERKLHGTVKEEHWDLEIATHQLQSAGFEILDAKEEFPKTMFRDVGAVVFYLRAIPWVIPDFNVQRYRKELAELHQQMQAEGKLEVTSHRFYLEASKRT
jgi:SAM-dependent methyltransferase